MPLVISYFLCANATQSLVLEKLRQRFRAFSINLACSFSHAPETLWNVLGQSPGNPHAREAAPSASTRLLPRTAPSHKLLMQMESVLPFSGSQRTSMPDFVHRHIREIDTALWM